jgi:hypothetical protein
MSLPDYRQLLRQDLPGSPDWVDGLISPINLFFEQTYSLLNGDVDFTNIRGSIASATFTTPSNYSDGVNNNFTPFTFPITFQGASIVLIGNCVINSNNYSTGFKPVGLPVGGWRETAPGKITVNYMNGLAASTSYKVSFLVF